MSHEGNIEKLQSVYASFACGNVSAIVAALDPEFVWTNPGPSAEFSYFGTHTGRNAALRVFQFIGDHLQMQKFEPYRFLADGDTVVVLIRQEATVRSSGRARSYAQTCAHVWTLKDGTPIALHDLQDTMVVVSALRG
jgi:ketosteroid isomerase-like protein